MVVDNRTTRFLNGPFIFFGFGFIVVFVFALTVQRWGLAAFSGVLSWFVYGSFSGCEIDTEKQIYRTYNKYFGIFKYGKWKSLKDFAGITLVPMKKVYTMYSRSNRVNESKTKEYRIYFVNHQKKPAVFIVGFKKPEPAQQKLDEFSIWFKMPVFSIKR